MENKRKELHYLSIGMFALITLQIIDIIQYIMGMNALDTTGMDAAALAVLPVINGLAIGFTAIGAIVLAILGVKGILEAKNPTSARFHINLAIIACIFFGLSTISNIGDLFKSTDLFNDIGAVLISGLFFIDTLYYAMVARTVRIED